MRPHPVVGPPRRAARQARLWRGLLVMALALAIGSAGRSVLAQAGDTVSVSYSVKADYPGKICVGSKTKINVSVERAVKLLAQGEDNFLNRVPMDGVVIEAKGYDPFVVNLASNVEIVGLNNALPPVATFRVQGKQAGTTTIFFHARLTDMVDLAGWPGVTGNQYWPQPVEVKECQFIVTTVSTWQVPGEAEVEFQAMIDQAKIVSDGKGTGHYTGSATVQWTSSVAVVNDCVGALVMSTSQADLTGDLGDDEVLRVNVNFKPATVLTGIACANSEGRADGTNVYTVTPDPLAVSVPASGGGASSAQVLQGPERLSGEAEIFVTRVTD